MKCEVTDCANDAKWEQDDRYKDGGHFRTVNGICVCSKHKWRWTKYKSFVIDNPREKSPDHQIDFSITIGYDGIHGRNRRFRGKAKEYSCKHCGNMAEDWALIEPGSGENHYSVERSGSSLFVSKDPWDYMPLCKSCHGSYDKKGIG